MFPMPLTLEWSDALGRIAFAVLAGSLVGLNRGESGKVAGLRTTLLVCLAACLAMLQVNAMLAQTGKTSASFAVLDLMRLPLGILSGVGFIGAGAILRKDGLVKGVTTAATLWYVTVIGLCIGGGQMAVGAIGLAPGLVVLWGAKWVESRLPRARSAQVIVSYESGSLFREAFIDSFERNGCRLVAVAFSMQAVSTIREETFEVHWQAHDDADVTPALRDPALIHAATSFRWSTAR